MNISRNERNKVKSTSSTNKQTPKQICSWAHRAIPLSTKPSRDVQWLKSLSSLGDSTRHHSRVSLWACCCFSGSAAVQRHSQWILWAAGREEPGAGAMTSSSTIYYFKMSSATHSCPGNCCCPTDIVVSRCNSKSKGEKRHSEISFSNRVGCILYFPVGILRNKKSKSAKI